MDEEWIAQIVKDAMKKKRVGGVNSTTAVSKMADDEPKIPISDIVDKYNDILKHVIREEGVQPVLDGDDIVKFKGVVCVPNAIDLGLQRKLMNVDGTCEIAYDSIGKGEMQLTILYTKNTADRLFYRQQRQQHETKRRIIVVKTDDTVPAGVVDDDVSMLTSVLKCNVPVDSSVYPIVHSRNVSKTTKIVSMTIGLLNPCRSNDLVLVAAAQGDNLRSLKIFPHSSNQVICLTAEINSRIIQSNENTSTASVASASTGGRGGV